MDNVINFKGQKALLEWDQFFEQFAFTPEQREELSLEHKALLNDLTTRLEAVDYSFSIQLANEEEAKKLQESIDALRNDLNDIINKQFADLCFKTTEIYALKNGCYV